MVGSIFAFSVGFITLRIVSHRTQASDNSSRLSERTRWNLWWTVLSIIRSERTRSYEIYPGLVSTYTSSKVTDLHATP